MVRRPTSQTVLFCIQCLQQRNLPVRIGIRYYNKSKLSPIQPPSELSPTSPYFVPRKLGQTTRLSTYYDEIIAPNYLLMNYDPNPKKQRQLLPLRWDGTSPYHKNRPQPRQQVLPKLRKPITADNLPRVKSITVHSMVKGSIHRRPDLLSAALAVQSITGQRPEFVHSKSSVAVFKLRPRMFLTIQHINNRDSDRSKNNVKRLADVEFPINVGRSRSSSSQRF